MTGAERMAVDVNIVAGMLRAERTAEEERTAIVAALRRWAEEGGDPWMSYCADRIEEGAHMSPEK